MTEADIQKANTWLHEAEYILIAAGAGMSASAGLDYTDFDLFQTMFPAMWKVGFRCMYHFIGYHSQFCPDGVTPWSDELKWGYLADQVIHARFEWPNHSIYQNVLQIVRTKEESKTFVISTNADGMFVQNGFTPERIYNPQGDYSNLQCLRQCRTNAFWPSEPILRNILTTVDKSTQKCSPEVVPKCPYCQGPVFFNVRGGNWFIEDVFDRKQSFSTWLQSTKKSKLVILEIGVGFNTPSVLRWPMESVTYSNSSTRLIRINMEHAEVPDEIVDKSISISEDATNAVNRISELYLQTL